MIFYAFFFTLTIIKVGIIIIERVRTDTELRDYSGSFTYYSVDTFCTEVKWGAKFTFWAAGQAVIGIHIRIIENIVKSWQAFAKIRDVSISSLARVTLEMRHSTGKASIFLTRYTVPSWYFWERKIVIESIITGAIWS
jgi:lipoate-protein ligase B